MTASGRSADDLVPLIDLSGWEADRGPARAATAAAIDAACRDVGFMQVIGHGVAQHAIDAMLAATGHFFDRPVEKKLAVRTPGVEVDRGYSPLGSESLAYSIGVDRPPDLFEAFNVGPEGWPVGDPVREAERHRWFAPNVWPDDDPELRSAVMGYFDQAAAAARRILGACAVALGLDERFFADKTDHSTDVLRIVNYLRAPGSGEPLPGQQRMGAHTDYGIITVLWADPVAGLQIVGPDGAWHDVVPAPGALLINLGDLLAQWTNDRWRSTLHRVIPPPPGSGGAARRRSAAFFHDGNYDALVECLPTCATADQPARYAPVLAGDHLLAKLVGPRTLQPSSAADTTGDRRAAV